MTPQHSERRRMQRASARMVLVVALCVVLGATLAVYAARPTRQGWGLAAAATLSPLPNPATIAVGASDTVVWSITEIDDLFAFELRLSFDPTVVQVIDADLVMPGVQVQMGSIPSSVDWNVVMNYVDNSAGTIWAASTLVQDHTRYDGAGSLIEVEFQAIAEGSSPLDFAALYVSNELGTAHDVEGINGAINVLPSNVTPTITPTPSATPSDAPTPTLTPTIELGVARLVLEPEHQQVAVGLTTALDIRIEDVVDLFGVEMELTFDPALMLGVDTNDVLSGIQLEIGDFLYPDYAPINAIYNVTGTISLAITQVDPRLPVSGSGRLGRIIFQGLQPGVSPVHIVTATLSDGQGAVLPATLHDADVQVVSQGTLFGQLAFEGRGAAPNASWACPISVTLSAPGGGTPLYTLASSTDAYGVFSTTNVITGTYDVRVHDLHSLCNVYRNLEIGAAGANVDFGTLVDGDANLNGAIEILDYAILAEAFGTVLGDPGFDPQADFNDSLAVDILDFSLLATSYGQIGEVDVTP